MKCFAVILSAVFLQITRCSDVLEDVPMPTIDVYAPKGLKLAIPDSRNMELVEFFVTLPGSRDPEVQKLDRPDGGYWTYWNPEVEINLYEKFHYKILVKRHGVYCKREGTHVVQKRTQLSGRSNVEDHRIEGQRVISGFPSLDNSERHVGAMSSGKSSNFMSSYSMYKSADVKPVTKSSMSKTSGTFVVKPSGVMEATGYREGSNFDSTKSEGEQWEHYRSSLTTEELENMKKMYESGFTGFHDFVGKMFANNMLPFERRFPGAIDGGDNPVVTQQFHETHETRESYSHSNPATRFRFTESGRGDMSTSESQKYHRIENVVPNAQKLVQMSQTKEYSNREVVGPSYPVMSSGVQHSERSSGHVHATETSSRAYDGNIFTSFKTVMPRYPQECVLVPGSDYLPSGTLREVEKFARELSCLATIYEASMRQEMAYLKERNSELSRKLDQVDREVKRLERTCNCY